MSSTGPIDLTKLDLASLSSMAETTNSREYDQLINSSIDANWLIFLSNNRNEKAIQRLIDNMGYWGSAELNVLTHLSRNGVLKAAKELISRDKLHLLAEPYERQSHCQETLLKLALIDNDSAKILWGYNVGAYLDYGDLVKIARQHLDIARLYIRDCQEYHEKLKRNYEDYDYRNNFYSSANLCSVIIRHPALIDEVLNKRYTPESSAYDKLVKELIWRNLDALCKDMPSRFLSFLNNPSLMHNVSAPSIEFYANKYPLVFATWWESASLNLEENCPQFTDSQETFDHIVDTAKAFAAILQKPKPEPLPEISGPIDSLTLTFQFDQVSLSAQSSASSSTPVEDKLKRNRSASW